jgi:hypothetical protein
LDGRADAPLEAELRLVLLRYGVEWLHAREAELGGDARRLGIS